MELKIDPNKTYAIALEGGGARGAYQVGAWRALDEVGIRYNAVSGSSVGALNGAMMAMRDRELAEKLWLDMRFSRVLDVDDDIMQKLFKKDFSGLSFDRIKADIKRLAQDRGFDATPLRNMIAEYVDPVKVRESGVDFYISTYSVTDKEGLDLRASELSSEELCNMLISPFSSTKCSAAKNIPTAVLSTFFRYRPLSKTTIKTSSPSDFTVLGLKNG